MITWSQVPSPYNTWFINTVIIIMNERTARWLLRWVWWEGGGGIVAASYKKVEVYFLVGSHSFPSGCCGQKKAPLSGASPPQMSLSKKHLRMHYGHAPLPLQNSFFRVSCSFGWKNSLCINLVWPHIFVLMHIQFRFLVTQKSCILHYFVLRITGKRA